MLVFKYLNVGDYKLMVDFEEGLEEMGKEFEATNSVCGSIRAIMNSIENIPMGMLPKYLGVRNTSHAKEQVPFEQQCYFNLANTTNTYLQGLNEIQKLVQFGEDFTKSELISEILNIINTTKEKAYERDEE